MSYLKESLETLHTHANDFRRKALQQILLPLIPGQKILDVGCGMGFMTAALASQGRAVVAVDILYDYVAFTVRQTSSAPHPARGVIFMGEPLPFTDQSFDTIICLDVIEHVENDRTLLVDFGRLLRPNGTLVVTVPALQALYGQRDVALGHHRRYNKSQLQERLTVAGFDINQLNYWNILGVGPYFVSERVFKRQLPDNIRQGQPTPWRKLAGDLLCQWLLFEKHLPLPFGLSLIALARKPTKNFACQEPGNLLNSPPVP